MQVSGMKEVMENSSSLPLRGLKVLKDLPMFNTSKQESVRYTAEKQKEKPNVPKRNREPSLGEKSTYQEKKFFLTSCRCLFYGRL